MTGIYTPGALYREAPAFQKWTPDCLECSKPMADHSFWDAHEGRVLRFRCIRRDCGNSIFKAVSVPSFWSVQ